MSKKRSYKTRAGQKRSRYYLIFSLILALVLLKWGFPLVVEIIGRTGGSSSVSTVEEDFLPPQPPVLDALPEATNSGRLKIEGYTEPGAKLSVWLSGGLEATDTADEEGSFSIWVELDEGENEIVVKAKDEAENESFSVTKVVEWDKEPLEMSVDNPQEGSEYFGQQNQTIEVKGTVNKDKARVTINGLYTNVDGEGVFSHALRLSEGENTIEVVATDPAGNINTISLKIRYVQ